jgi:hypothetical protein
MMRFNITQPISRQSKMLIDSHPKYADASDEAQEDDAERDAKSCDPVPNGR